jgi:hypothetical protein
VPPHTPEVAERQVVGPVKPHRIHHRVDREVDEVGSKVSWAVPR